MNIAPAPGAFAWSTPLRACLESHGAKVDFVDIGGDFSKTPSVLSGFLSGGDQVIFDVAVPLSGQANLLAQAKSKKIPVIGFSTGFADGMVTMSADDAALGTGAAKYIADNVPSGDVLMLQYSTQPSVKLRTDAASTLLKQHASLSVKTVEIPGLTVILAQPAVSAALAGDPNIKAVLAPTGNFGVGAANAIAARSGSKAIVSSVNGDLPELAAIKTGGPLKATQASNIAALAQYACQTASVMLKGGNPLATNVRGGVTQITASNLPPEGKLSDVPITLVPAQ